MVSGRYSLPPSELLSDEPMSTSQRARIFRPFSAQSAKASNARVSISPVGHKAIYYRFPPLAIVLHPRVVTGPRPRTADDCVNWMRLRIPVKSLARKRGFGTVAPSVVFTLLLSPNYYNRNGA